MKSVRRMFRAIRLVLMILGQLLVDLISRAEEIILHLAKKISAENFFCNIVDGKLLLS
jgi:hypothetical protein